jgi:hypothetical protein
MYTGKIRQIAAKQRQKRPMAKKKGKDKNLDAAFGITFKSPVNLETFSA